MLPSLTQEAACVHGVQFKLLVEVLPVQVLLRAYLEAGQVHATHSAVSFVVSPLHSEDMYSPELQPLGLQGMQTVSLVVPPEHAILMYCPLSHLLLHAVHVLSYRLAAGHDPVTLHCANEHSLDMYSWTPHVFPQTIHLLLSTVSNPVH